MHDAATIDRIQRMYTRLSAGLDERSRRLWAAAEALELGWGGSSVVATATGLSRTTIRAGIVDLRGPCQDPARVRRHGAGRKSVTAADPNLRGCLESLIEPTEQGKHKSPLRWTIRSARVLAQMLKRQGHPISHSTVLLLLREDGYSLQSNRRIREGPNHPDRNAQFSYLNEKVVLFQRRRQPVVSVDTKMNELVGDPKNEGKEYRRQGRQQKMRAHDFEHEDVGKAFPYSVHDLQNDEGWVSVGIDHDTAEFAANTIRLWWKRKRRMRFSNAKELLITADSGRSNSVRSRLWKIALQKLADDTGLKITVCHFPAGTCKWNKIERRLHSFITMNCRGKTMVSVEAILELIGNRSTQTELQVRTYLDPNIYKLGIELSDEKLVKVNVHPHAFYGDWNYTIVPN